MKGLSKLLQTAFTKLVDPEREDRVRSLVRAIKHGLREKRENFSVSNDLRGIEFNPIDLDLAKERAYHDMLENLWRDNKLSDREQQMTKWVAQCIQMPATTAARMNLEFAKERFAVALAEAMEDGILDQHEEMRLRAIAESIGSSLHVFARTFFASEGESFLRSIFLAAIDDGEISDLEWNRLLETSMKLGLSPEELLQAIRPQAQRFVEHVLVDAKADNRITPTEKRTLDWLLNNLDVGESFRRYAQSEIDELILLTEIDAGRLPSITSPIGIETRAGEIVHYVGPAEWHIMKILRSGTDVQRHAGTLALTDHRLVFSSPTKSQSFNYRKIIEHQGFRNRIDLQIEGKPLTQFYLKKPSAIAYAIFSSAVAMANQTKVVTFDGLPTRHIPRDVRQRVWQRYGGRCAECNADDYLEFDHIIPVAKGGGNTDNNVQLLCRRCNSRKSDNI